MHLLHRLGNTCWQPSIISPVWSILWSQRGDDDDDDDGDNDSDDDYDGLYLRRFYL